MDRVVKNAIAVIRPPGHHAEPSQAMGFCLFNNVAVATKVMQRRYGDTCQRVMILDWYTMISTVLKIGMYTMETAPKQLSNQIRVFYIFHFIDLVSILRTRQRKVAGIAVKDLDLESNRLDGPKLISGM
jgi:Histone deacetylase domain